MQVVMEEVTNIIKKMGMFSVIVTRVRNGYRFEGITLTEKENIYVRTMIEVTPKHTDIKVYTSNLVKKLTLFEVRYQTEDEQAFLRLSITLKDKVVEGLRVTGVQLKEVKVNKVWLLLYKDYFLKDKKMNRLRMTIKTCSILRSADVLTVEYDDLFYHFYNGEDKHFTTRDSSEAFIYTILQKLLSHNIVDTLIKQL